MTCINNCVGIALKQYEISIYMFHVDLYEVLYAICGHAFSTK